MIFTAMIIVGFALWGILAILDQNRKAEKQSYAPIQEEMDKMIKENERRIKLSDAIVKLSERKREIGPFATPEALRILDRNLSNAHIELQELGMNNSAVIGEPRPMITNSSVIGDPRPQVLSPSGLVEEKQA